MKTIIRFALLAIAILSVGVTGQSNYEEGRFALSDSRPQSCELIIDTSRFYGTCCSLNTTTANGCVLNVKNGWCRITGQFWSYTWNSTDDRITCDGSEFEIEYTPDRTTATGGTNTDSPAASVPLAGLVALSAAISAFLL
ncbi:unnamed protein product [Cylindrotheca closterium]|uniref:Uncharacterized protein n=1 Tax=Cylindrotheca closterium TaxID=2856 RepID=A0AAD2JIU8_9STRA|nr:unnamed protein product [Cylindrotheca closterium]